MTYITKELKESFKDYLAEQSFIYEDNKQGLTLIIGITETLLSPGS